MPTHKPELGGPVKCIEIGIRQKVIILTIATHTNAFEFQFSGEGGMSRAIANLNKGRIRDLVDNDPD